MNELLFNVRKLYYRMNVIKVYFFVGLIVIPYTVNAQIPDFVQAIDLGLPSGNLWASYNLGAKSVNDNYGDYFAWGETAPKSMYLESTYFDSDDNCTTFKKYSLQSGKTHLDLEDEAAHILWGGNWRIPSKEDMLEIQNEDYCIWTFSIARATVKNRINGNSICFPYAGRKFGGERTGLGGYYQTADLYDPSEYGYDQVEGAFFLMSVYSAGIGGMICADRFEGTSIRPIISGNCFSERLIEEQVLQKTSFFPLMAIN